MQVILIYNENHSSKIVIHLTDNMQAQTLSGNSSLEKSNQSIPYLWPNNWKLMNHALKLHDLLS